MNKKVRTICIGGGIAIIALFSSCKNFMQGSDVLSGLEKSIDYANAQTAEVEISVSSDYVKNVYPGIGRYAKELRPTDTLDVSIEEKENYQFIKWTAEPQESVSFEDCTAHSTKITIVDSTQKIIIKPILLERPSVISFSPSQFLENPRNSTIELLFSHQMQLTQEDVEKIEIISNGEDLINNFETAKISEDKTKIIFDANYDNLIPVLNGIRTVEVSVPCDFYYETEDENKYQITIGQAGNKQTFSYKITPETSTKFAVTVKNNDKNAGSSNINGNYEMSLGVTKDLIFNTSSDYAFIEWQIFDKENKKLSKKDYEKDFVFSDEKSQETAITASHLREGYQIVPFCVARPSIVSATPTYDANGVYRDRRIAIMFDQPIDEDTIYYTEAEMKAIEVENPEVIVVFLDTQDKPGKYYGYQINQNIIWKCISITKRSDKNVSLLNCYQPPVFDTESSDVIRILTKTDETEMPPVQTEILVNINPVFGITVPCSDYTSKLVSFANKYSWTYRTNNRYDDEPPELTSLKLSVADEKIYELKHTTEYTVLYDEIKTRCKEAGFDSSNLAKIVSKGNLVIDAKITDAGSGPQELKVEIEKLDSNLLYNEQDKFNLYPLRNNEDANKVYLEYNVPLIINGSDAEVNGEIIDLSNLPGDGLYKMNLIVKDSNGKELDVEEDSKKNIYFIYDNEGPVLTTISENRLEKQSTVTWQKPTNDYSDVVAIEYKKDDESITEWTKINFSAGEMSAQTNTDLEDGTRYVYRFTTSDFAGNTSVTTYKNTSAPDFNITFVSEKRDKDGKGVVTWTEPEDSCFSHVEIECVKGTIYSSGDKYLMTKNTTSHQFENLELGRMYSYYATAYDWSGNASERIMFTDSTRPSPPEHIYTDVKRSNTTVYAYSPENDDSIWYTGIMVNRVEVNKTYDKGAPVSYNFQTAASGYASRIEVYTVNYSGGRSEASSVSSESFQAGLIYYSDGTTSMNYYDWKKPIGIVFDITSGFENINGKSYPKSKMISIDKVELKAATGGSSKTSGLENYVAAGNGSAGDYQYYLINIRNKDATLTANEKFTWYVPAVEEFSNLYGVSGPYIVGKTAYDSLDGSLKKVGGSSLKEQDAILWSSTKDDSDNNKSYFLNGKVYLVGSNKGNTYSQGNKDYSSGTKSNTEQYPTRFVTRVNLNN